MLTSPALTEQSKFYPAIWNGRVPKRVRMVETVRSDFAFLIPASELPMTAYSGQEYPCWVNRHGAVAVIFPFGQKLGVKPYEFEVIEWHEGVK